MKSSLRIALAAVVAAIALVGAAANVALATADLDLAACHAQARPVR